MLLSLEPFVINVPLQKYTTAIYSHIYNININILSIYNLQYLKIISKINHYLLHWTTLKWL